MRAAGNGRVHFYPTGGEKKRQLRRRAVLLGAMAEQKRWTQTDITELRARLELGDTAEAIGELLDRSTVDIFGMMSRLSLRVRTSS